MLATSSLHYDCKIYFLILSGSVFSKLRIIRGRRTVITAAVKEVQDVDIAPFRVLESYPPNHNARHLSRIYTVPSDVTKLLKSELPKDTLKRVDIFREFGILVRKPAIELISYLEQTDYAKPVNRYVLCILFNLFIILNITFVI